jgi:dTDP-4-amino-4,6-dideoxygalactose transaminase
MIPRKKIDITWGDLAFAATAQLRAVGGPAADDLRIEVEGLMGEPGETMACLSVRSGFDLLLTALDLPAGSEVLVSAVTIHDMIRIIEEHGLVPVPVDLDMDTLSVRPDALERAWSPRARVLLAAHLFGSRMPMPPLVEFARAKGLLLVEDAAQAFDGTWYHGDPGSDVVLFSFGPIKTHTALGGGLAIVRDPEIRDTMRSLHRLQPVQPDGEFTQRALKYMGIVGVSAEAPFTAATALLRTVGIDHDRVLSKALKGFAGSGFFKRIRRRPSTALLRTLYRRLSTFDPAAIQARSSHGESVLHALPAHNIPGRSAAHRTHWVIPLRVPDPEARIPQLWERGLDATRGTTSITLLPPPGTRPETHPRHAEQAMRELLFLPAYPEAPQRAMDRLLETVQAWPTVGTDSPAVARG